MKEYIEERAVAIANYIIDHNATVRQTAKRFGISKSTVHKDVTDRLTHINPGLASQARVVLHVNKSELHIRGGLATGEKYQHRLLACSNEASCEMPSGAPVGLFPARPLLLVPAMDTGSTRRALGVCAVLNSYEWS